METILILCIIALFGYIVFRERKTPAPTAARDPAQANMIESLAVENVQLRRELEIREVHDLCRNIFDQVESELSKTEPVRLMPGMAFYHAWSSLHDFANELASKAAAAPPEELRRMLVALRYVDANASSEVAERVCEVAIKQNRLLETIELEIIKETIAEGVTSPDAVREKAALVRRLAVQQTELLTRRAKRS